MSRRVQPAAFVSALALVLLATASPALAGNAKEKKARRGDVASSYTLDAKGNLFRTVAGHRCQVTNKVVDFKVSQHPQDLAVIYFVRTEDRRADLYVLHNAETTGQCPKAEKVRILRNVAKEGQRYRYNVVPSTRSAIVSMGLDARGNFRAWSRSDTVVNLQGIRDYRLHDAFGKKGAPFKSFVGFAIDRRGRIFKVGGSEPSRSGFEPGREYSSLRQFAAERL